MFNEESKQTHLVNATIFEIEILQGFNMGLTFNPDCTVEEQEEGFKRFIYYDTILKKITTPERYQQNIEAMRDQAVIMANMTESERNEIVQYLSDKFTGN